METGSLVMRTKLVGGGIPHGGRTAVSRKVSTFRSATAAFRRSPANFARFIGDFRNAALNCA